MISLTTKSLIFGEAVKAYIALAEQAELSTHALEAHELRRVATNWIEAYAEMTGKTLAAAGLLVLDEAERRSGMNTSTTEVFLVEGEPRLGTPV